MTVKNALNSFNYNQSRLPEIFDSKLKQDQKTELKEAPNNKISENPGDDTHRQSFNQSNDSQTSAAKTDGSSQITQKSTNDDIDARYFVFLEANNLNFSPESLRQFNEMKDWLDGKSKPVSELPADQNLRASYNNHRQNYDLADSEELRRKFIKGYEDVQSGKSPAVFSDEEREFLDVWQERKKQVKADLPNKPRVAKPPIQQPATNAGKNPANRPRNDFRLPGGEKIAVSRDQKEVAEGFVRVETEKGEKWLINPNTKEILNEADQQITDTIPVVLVPRAKSATTSPEMAQELYVNQVADAISKKYDGTFKIDNQAQIKLPLSDVKDWMNLRGIVDFKTKRPLPSETFYAPRGGLATENYYLRQADLKDLAAFSQQRRDSLENAYLEIVASGRDFTPEEAAFFKEHEVSLKGLEDKRYADVQLAQTKGSVAKGDFERYHTEELAKNNNDEAIANLKSSQRVGWITTAQRDEGLGKYAAFRENIKEDLYQEKLLGYRAAQGNWTGTSQPAQRPLPKKEELVSEDDISQRIEELRKYELSPQEIREAKQVADFYNRYMGVYGSSLLSGFLSAGGKTMHTIAGVLRIAGAESAAISLSKFGSKELLAGDRMGDQNSTVSYSIKLLSGAVLDLPRIILLSATPLRVIGGFAISGGLESAGRGDSPSRIISETTKGAMFGALLQGAGNLGKSVMNRTFFKNAPKELMESLSPSEKDFLVRIASDARGLPPKAFQKAILSKVLGDSTRIGTIFGGTVGIEKATGATNEEAFTNAARMVIFDLVLHAAGKGVTKITSESLDPIRHKLFRVVANNEAKIVSVNERNEIVVYNKLENLPKAVQDKIIDGTFVAKDGTYQIKVNKNAETTGNNKPSVEARKLYEIREKLSPTAQREFDVMRKTKNNDADFLRVITNADPLRMFEAMGRKKAVAPINQRIEQEAMEKARTLIDNPQFVNKSAVWNAINNDKGAKTEVVREQISIEIVKAELEKTYPKSAGYEIQTGVKIYKETEYQTVNEWLKNHPTLKITGTKGLIEHNGRVWQPVTDMDIAVVKKTADGKLEIVRTEEIKSGRNDVAGEAEKQLTKIKNGLNKIKNKDASVKIFVGGKDITENYKVDGTIKFVTRGADDRMNFDKKIGLTSKQITRLAEKIIKENRTGDQK